jgi:hypothetical protein
MLPENGPVPHSQGRHDRAKLGFGERPVYSLGSNQKDNGGRSIYVITHLVMDKDDDWTWKEDR